MLARERWIIELNQTFTIFYVYKKMSKIVTSDTRNYFPISLSIQGMARFVKPTLLQFLNWFYYWISRHSTFFAFNIIIFPIAYTWTTTETFNSLFFPSLCIVRFVWPWKFHDKSISNRIWLDGSDCVKIFVNNFSSNFFSFTF